MKKRFYSFLSLLVVFSFIISLSVGTYGLKSASKAINIPKDYQGNTYIIKFRAPSLLEYQNSFSYKLLSLVSDRTDENYLKKLSVRHESLKCLVLELGGSVNSDFYSVFNGMSISGNDALLKALINTGQVDGIYPDEQCFLERDITSKVIESNLVFKEKDKNGNFITGIGMKVGIIDTGVDYLHKELGGAKFPNSKVVGGYDFADNDPDPMDDDGHGTHVAGIFAGSENGIAKDAKIYAYKVFSKGNSTTSTSLIIKAIDQAVSDKCDVVNISIGIHNGASIAQDALSTAVRNAINANIVVVASAGNSGVPSEFVENPLTAPASVDLAIGVGASDDSETGIINASNRTIIAQYAIESPKFTSGNYNIVYCGLGKVEDFKGLDVKGKIALIERGEIYFGDKDLNAKDSGAIGVIVYNNVPGMPDVTLVSQDQPGRNDFIPFLFISFNDGQFLKNLSNETVSISNVYGLGRLASFSSMGPTSDFYLKPDLVAPGVNINSTYLDNTYTEMSGTSMASPVVAGCATLLKQAKPELKATEIKYLLMNTADVLTNSVSNLPYSPLLQGSGRVNIYNAVNTSSYVYPASLIFGNGVNKKSFTLTFKNLDTISKTFSVSLLYGSNEKVTIDIPSTISVDGKSSKNVSVSFEAASNISHSYGFIFFTSKNEKLHIPFVYLNDVPENDFLFDVSLSNSVINSQTGSIYLNFSVGTGSVSQSENETFRETLAENVKVSIYDSLGNLIYNVFDQSPLYVGDYGISITPFDVSSNVLFLKNGVYFYKISYNETNDDEKTKNIYQTVSRKELSGSFTVQYPQTTGRFEFSVVNNYTLLLQANDVFDLNLNVNPLSSFTSLTFDLHFDINALKLLAAEILDENVLLSYKNTKSGAHFAVLSNTKIQRARLKLSFLSKNNKEGFITIANPKSDTTTNFFVKPLYYNISPYSRMFDFNSDKVVNNLDLTIFKQSFNLTSSQKDFNPDCDLNFDGIVDEKDFFIFSKHFGEVYP
ncbi:MAG: S8 family serine peptidase [Caldisericaceae bacterium]